MENLDKMVKMKKNAYSILTVCTLSGTLLSGCIQPDTKTAPKVESLQADTTVYLKEGMNNPNCQINLSLSYLQPASETDSLSLKINAAIQEAAFGKSYEALPAGEVAATLQKEYIDNYLTDVKQLFDADMYNGMKPEDIPQWYNYQYDISSSLQMGKDSIWNYGITYFSDTGGAHPNTQKKYFNINSATGEMITAGQVFSPKHEKEICDLILKQLIYEMNQRMNTDTITSVAGLNEFGILLDSSLYIPENFLLEKEGVMFYYNRYEIAPYSAGDFSLTVPYEQINAYLKK